MMRIYQALLFSIFICTISLSLAVPRLVSETVGSAQNQVLTSRGMTLSFVVENSMNKKNRSLPATKEEKIQAVNTFLLDVMVNFEAQSLGFKEVSKDELEALVTATEKLTSDPMIKSYKFQKSEIRQMAEQKLIVKSFLKNNANSFESILTDQDLQNYYDKNRLRFGTVPLSEVKENIRVYLMQQQRDDRLKAWIEVLKKKYKARNYLIERQGQDAKSEDRSRS